MSLAQLGSEIEERGLRGITLFTKDKGWMVSVRNEQGFRTHYGDDLTETVFRALAGGPQLPPDEDDEDLGDLI